MSYDFALYRFCQHQVSFELAQRDHTKEFIYFGRPPAGNSAMLYINGVHVPSDGLYSYAEVPFTKPEPYKITAGKNDLLYIGIGNDIPKFVQLLTGDNIRASDMARDLSVKLPELSVSVNKKRVVLRSKTSTNSVSFVLPDPRWTDKTNSSALTSRSVGAFSQLGITPGRVACGKLLYPGYDIIQDPNAPNLPQFKVMKLRGTIPNGNPLIQLSYVTFPNDCRRCFGSRIEFDYGVIGGSYETVQDTDLLAQEMDKFLYTKIGSHWKWSWLGSNLINRIGGKGNTSSGTVGSMVSIDISQAFRVYQNIKSQQAQRAPFQQVSDAEYPAQLDKIDIQPTPDDPTVVVVTTTIRSRSRIPVPLRRVIGNPNPFTLQGDPDFNVQLSGDTGFRLRG